MRNGIEKELRAIVRLLVVAICDGRGEYEPNRLLDYAYRDEPGDLNIDQDVRVR